MPDILDCGDGTRLKPLQASNRKPADGSYDIGGVLYLMAFSGCGIAILPCLSYWFGTSLERRYMARQHIIRVDLICVVFLGDASEPHYATLVRSFPTAAHSISAHSRRIWPPASYTRRFRHGWGGTRRTVGRAKEYVNRGCGMGMCGDCPLHVHSPSRNSLCCMTAKPWIVRRIVARPSSWGCLLAYVGAHVGLRFAGTEHNDGDRHAMGKEAD